MAIQRCTLCDSATGRCAEDEFRVCEVGPLCEHCHDNLAPVLAHLATVEAERDALSGEVAKLTAIMRNVARGVSR